MLFDLELINRARITAASFGKALELLKADTEFFAIASKLGGRLKWVNCAWQMTKSGEREGVLNEAPESDLDLMQGSIVGERVQLEGLESGPILPILDL